MVKCQNCKFLEKIDYKNARPTHHENWICRADGCTKQYEDTTADRKCSRFEEQIGQK